MEHLIDASKPDLSEGETLLLRSDQGFLAAARTGVFSGSVLVPDDLERIDL